MFRSARARAGLMLLGAVGALSMSASKADVMWIAGYVLEDEELMDDGETGMVIGGTAIAAGSLMTSTGIGASIGAPMVTGGTIAALIGG